jgi:hypothetical protein
LATVCVILGPGECLLSTRLRTPGGKAPVSGAGRIAPVSSGRRS